MSIYKVKKRLKQYFKFPGGVTAVAFNCDGSRIAVWVSSTWDEGEADFKVNPATPRLHAWKVGNEVKVGFSLIVLATFYLFPSCSHYSLLTLSSLQAQVVDRELILLCVTLMKTKNYTVKVRPLKVRCVEMKQFKALFSMRLYSQKI